MDYRTFNQTNLLNNDNRPYTTMDKHETYNKEYENKIEKSLLDNNKLN